MTNLSKALRARLALELPLYELRQVRSVAGEETVKWLWEARDGARIESVRILAPDRITHCLSSEVGCAQGCRFCATGLGGYERPLAAHEILEQHLQMSARSEARATHVVFMGMGEPLRNYEQVLAAARRLNAPPPEGCGVGARRITVSTVGLVSGILRLAEEKLQLELAVSLHAPDDATRERLVPSARGRGLGEILRAAREFSRRTGRLVSYEYVLLAGVNDSPAQARALGALLREQPCKVNLIPFNPVEGAEFERPAAEEVERFRSELEAAGVSVTVRVSKGQGVEAACGQLRRRVKDAGTET
jgi:23S rRNA (adenine2503-C2)-methyltransferase